jgi:hypothetical protein
MTMLAVPAGADIDAELEWEKCDKRKKMVRIAKPRIAAAWSCLLRCKESLDERVWDVV